MSSALVTVGHTLSEDALRERKGGIALATRAPNGRGSMFTLGKAVDVGDMIARPGDLLFTYPRKLRTASSMAGSPQVPVVATLRGELVHLTSRQKLLYDVAHNSALVEVGTGNALPPVLSANEMTSAIAVHCDTNLAFAQSDPPHLRPVPVDLPLLVLLALLSRSCDLFGAHQQERLDPSPTDDINDVVQRSLPQFQEVQQRQQQLAILRQVLRQLLRVVPGPSVDDLVLSLHGGSFQELS